MTEQSLHEQLKEVYSRNENMEESVDGYIIDVVRDSLLIEIQTGNFSTIKAKLEDLLHKHKVRLVHPIPYMKWIIRLDKEGRNVSKRRSPKRGRMEDVFYELVYIPEICSHSNFELEVALVNAEEFWIDDGKGSWRRKNWSVIDRKLVSIHETHLFKELIDYLEFLPDDLPNIFTSKQLSKEAGLKLRLAQKIVYCLRKMHLLRICGKKGRAHRYMIHKLSS